MYPATVTSSWGVKAEAVQVTLENAEEVAKWVNGEVVNISTTIREVPFAFHAVKIPVEVGISWAYIGDFIVRWPDNSHHFGVYPTKIFSEMFTYE